MTEIVSILLMVILLPIYVYILSMFAYMGKIAAIRSSMRLRRTNLTTDMKEEGEKTDEKEKEEKRL